MYTIVETHPNLTHVVSILERYTTNPDTFHLVIMKHVLIYIRRTVSQVNLQDNREHK